MPLFAANAATQIDDSSVKMVSGIYEFNRGIGGVLIIPAGTVFPVALSTPGDPIDRDLQDGEIFWRTDEARLYRYNLNSTTWEAVTTTVGSHSLGGSAHTATTLAALNALISDATLDDAGDPRTPTGSAGGDLGGSYPNPTVTDLTITGQTYGSILYYNGTSWVRLAPGTSGQYLETQGLGVSPQWSDPPQGDVVGPASATDNAVVRFDGTTGKLIQQSSVLIDDAGNVTITGTVNVTGNLVITGTVDGRNVSVDGTNLDNHIANTANPHATDLGNLGTGTLAELNNLVTDATLDDVTGARTPTAHSASHILGGADEVDGDQLDIDYTPTQYTPDTTPPEVSSGDHLSAHLAGINNALGVMSVFGQGAAFVQDTTPQVTTAITYTPYLTLNFTAPADGTYIIFFSFLWGYNSTTSDFLGRVTLDGSPVWDMREEPKDSGGAGPGGTNQRRAASGVYVSTLTAGSHPIQLLQASSQVGTSATIWQGFLYAYRIA